MFLSAGAMLVATQIKDHWIRAWYLWQVVLCFLTYTLVIITLGHPKVAEMHVANTDSMVKITVGMIILIAATKITDHVKAINALCYFTLFQCAVWGFQMIGLDLVGGIAHIAGATMIAMAPAGTLGNPNFFAAILAITLPLFFRDKWVYCVPVIIAILLWQRTSGGYVAAMAGAIYWVAKTRPKALIATIPAIIAISIFFWTNMDRLEFDEVRRYTWLSILSNWDNWILTGNGPGTYPMFGLIEHAHNDYLETAFEGGIISVGCMVGFLAMFYHRAVVIKDKTQILVISSIVALTVNCVFNYPLHLAPTTFVSLILLGIYTNARFQNIR